MCLFPKFHVFIYILSLSAPSSALLPSLFPSFLPSSSPFSLHLSLALPPSLSLCVFPFPCDKEVWGRRIIPFVHTVVFREPC